jgi:ABC-2 type transport system permease protein
MAVLDFDNTPTTRTIVKELSASGYFRIVGRLKSQAEIAQVLDSSQARTVIHFPVGFEDDMRSNRTARVQLLMDGSDSNTAAIVFGYANQIMQTYTARKLRERFREISGSHAEQVAVRIVPRALYNPNLESRYYYAPGLIAVMLIVFSMNLASISIVREKEIGTIEQVMVTPITRVEFILGKAIPPVITGYIGMSLMLVLAMLLFGVRIEGSLFLLYVLTGVYLVGNIGLALLVSVISVTQQQAFLTTFFIVMPAVLLSGFMFPVHNMPEVVQYVTLLNPIRWYLEIVRGVVMKGVGVTTLWPAITGQSVLALLFISIATLRFRKTLT